MKPVSVISILLAATSVVLVASEMPARAFSLGMVESTDTNTANNLTGQSSLSVLDTGSEIVQLDSTTSDPVSSPVTDMSSTQDNIVSDMMGNVANSINSTTSVSGATASLDSSTNDLSSNSQGQTGTSSSSTVSDINLTLAAQSYAIENTTTTTNLQNVSSTVDSTWVASNQIVEPVPEPLTILGTGIAFGFGGFLKREYDKKKRQN